MIYAEKGKERECFIDFVEKALGILAKEKYRDFLAVFDNSRILTEQELISALQYLDETRPALYVTDGEQGADIYYIFHLTYSKQNLEGFPKYEKFADIYAVKEFIEPAFIKTI